MAIKRVLITGSNSYVGTNVEKWLMKEPDKFYVETISVRGDAWKSFDFSKFDVVFHVAGIAHVKETKQNKDLYFKINRDLLSEVAIFAKNSGVKQLIFISSMSVFGLDEGVIFKDTLPHPITNYGKSKLEGEEILKTLASSNFKITILRPPMIYGLNSPGNFSKLMSYSRFFLFFPDFHNNRSIIHINNFSIAIRSIIIESIEGILLPADATYINSYLLVKNIRKIKNKYTFKFNLFNSLILILMRYSTKLKKVFSSFHYDKTIVFICKDYFSIEKSFLEMGKGNE